MRAVPSSLTDSWKAAAKTGGRKPVVRATIQVTNLKRFEYDTAMAAGGDWENGNQRSRPGVFASIIFGDHSGLREIPNIKSYSWSRSVDQDVATCSLTLLNAEVSAIGSPDENDEDFERPGHLTYNRGQQSASANRWGFDTDTGWQDILIPDRIVKTYEGYGFDPDQPPALDPNLVQSGVWVIDKVTYTKDGDITLEMRDVGRFLLQTVVFPPVIPYAEYPMRWDAIHTETKSLRAPEGGSWTRPWGEAVSSNEKYVGAGLTNAPYDSYVDANGGVNGHRPAHALANQDGEYWQSTGQDTARSMAWWQINLSSPTAVAGVRVNPRGGPYRVYISLKTEKGWIGKRKIPYHVTTGGVDIRAKIPFVESISANRNGDIDAVLRRKYAGVKAIRLTFTELKDAGVGEHPFWAGLKDMQIYAGSAGALTFGKKEVTQVKGNYRDYTDIVKWICAWGGFFWPPHSTGLDFIKIGGADPDRTISYASADEVLPRGRVWGDFMQSGTAGKAPLTVDLFDKQPLMDVINYIRDVLGFIFFIDETGGVVWRMPNLGLAGDPKRGNYLSPGQLGQRTKSRTSDFVTIDENETLLNYSTTLDSQNIRERIFVANSNGKIGVVIKGFRPQQVGFRRTAGWTDQNFADKRECVVAADMISAQQMFDYRRSKVQIPGNPAIQIDDQVRIFERVTNETFFHYVLGINCELNMESGVWTYDLDTHWLGENPSDAWVVDITQVDPATANYLHTLR